MQVRVYLILGLAVGVISTASILVKLAEAPAIIIAAYRLGIAGFFVVPLALMRRGSELKALSVRDWLWALLSGTFLALHFFTWISSLQYTSVASSVVLVATNPIFVGLGAVFILRERLAPLLVSGIVLSVLGALLIGFDDIRLGSAAVYGDLLALLGALMHSGYLLIGQRVRQRVDLLTYIALVYGMAAAVLVLFAAASGTAFMGYSTWTYLMLVLLALGPQLLGHSSYNWALRYVPAAVVAVVILGEPIGATILAYFILGEGLSWLKGFGAILVLIGIYLAIRARQRS
jgi:drug/metabolite transporter (DMT)-like permease